MFKNVLLAAAFVVASSPAFVSAQDFFFSFDEFSRAPTTTVGSNTATGSLFIFADENLDFEQLDLDFTNSNPNVVSFTGGVVFNSGAVLSGLASDAPGGSFTSFSLVNPNPPADGSAPGVTPTDGRLFATGFLTPGQSPVGVTPYGVVATNFRAGANGFLLAQVDFDIVGPGTSNFSFIAGDLGVVNDQTGPVNPDLSATGSITVEAVPEPSSSILLMLAAAAMVARRRRS